MAFAPTTRVGDTCECVCTCTSYFLLLGACALACYILYSYTSCCAARADCLMVPLLHCMWVSSSWLVCLVWIIVCFFACLVWLIVRFFAASKQSLAFLPPCSLQARDTARLWQHGFEHLTHTGWNALVYLLGPCIFSFRRPTVLGLLHVGVITYYALFVSALLFPCWFVIRRGWHQPWQLQRLQLLSQLKLQILPRGQLHT